MRWLLLLMFTGVAAFGAPLPEIKTGTHPQPIEIWETPWCSGSVSTSLAFLVGEAGGATFEVQTTPQQTLMSETCDVRVESAFGQLAHIHGIAVARLKSSQEASPYVPLDPGWGRIRHLQKGQKILLLIHDHEGPSFGHEALVPLTDATKDLPDILRRTGFSPGRFTAGDLQVLQMASPHLHDQVLQEGAGERQKLAQEENWPAWGVAGLLVAFGLVMWWRWKTQPEGRPAGCC